MRFVAILKAGDSPAIKVETTHSSGRCREDSARDAYDAFLFRHRQQQANCQGLALDIGEMGAAALRDLVTFSLDESGCDTGRRTGRCTWGQGFLPTTMLCASDGKNEIKGQLFLIVKGNDEDSSEIIEILKQVGHVQ